MEKTTFAVTLDSISKETIAPIVLKEPEKKKTIRKKYCVHVQAQIDIETADKLEKKCNEMGCLKSYFIRQALSKALSE